MSAMWEYEPPSSNEKKKLLAASIQRKAEQNWKPL